MIIETIVVTPIGANCYVVGCPDTKEAMVIDPGGDVDKILPILSHHDLTVKAIVGTHAHIDHAAGVEELKQATGAPFYLHPAEEPLLKSMPEYGSYFGMHVGGVPTVEHYLRTGDTVAFGKLVFDVLETPGHSPGGICLRSGQIIFVGDALFQGSIGRTDLPGGNHEQLLHSIQTQLLSLPDETVVYSGHGAPTTIGDERQFNPFCQGL